MTLQGYKHFPASNFSDPGPPPVLTAVPFFPPALQIKMNGTMVFTLDPASGTIEGFTDTGWGQVGCTFNPAPLAAAGIPVWQRTWTATCKIHRSAIQLATADNPYEDGSYDAYPSPFNPTLYRCVMPYTGPLPGGGGAITISANYSALTANRDSSIPKYNCSDNTPIGVNFIDQSSTPGPTLPVFSPNQKYQYMP